MGHIQKEEITLLGGRLRLLKAGDGGLHPSTDTVMLAAACPARPGEAVLDLGCGSGAAGLCVRMRVNVRLCGIDIQAPLIDLARENAALNGFEESCRFETADVRDFRTQEQKPGCPLFDHVICNPPYLEHGTHTVSPDPGRAKALSHSGKDTDLKLWIDCAFHSLHGRGSLTLIHRADHIDRVFAALGKRFGAIEVIPLWPKAEQPAGRIIIRARKHRRSPSVLHPGIVLHYANGGFTDAAESILNKGEPLPSTAVRRPAS